MASNGLVESFVGALQASLSVLLVILYGGIAAKLKLLDEKHAKAMSKISVRMFLPALLITKVGAELHAGSAARYGLILLWAIATHFVSFLLGMFAEHVLGLPSWTAIAVMFNNSTSYPLLLIESLSETGILENLIVTDESTSDAIERAKSYFLVYATVSSCLTFAVGPRLIDTEHAPEPDDEDEDKAGDDGAGNGDGSADQRDEEAATEHTGLLGRVTARGDGGQSHDPFRPIKKFFASVSDPEEAFRDRRSYAVSKSKWKKLSPRTRWWLLFVSDFFNAPLLGAILGVIIGLSPPLHKAFFANTDEGGIFTAWLTSSLKNIGNLFVPLPVVIAGVSLFSSIKSQTFNREALKKIPWATWAYVLLVRFVLWPVVSIGLIYLCASRTSFLGEDPMLWFTLMMMPTGPPAMKLVSLIQISGGSEEDEHVISRLLTVAYLISPILSLTVVGSLIASEKSL